MNKIGSKSFSLSISVGSEPSNTRVPKTTRNVKLVSKVLMDSAHRLDFISLPNGISLPMDHSSKTLPSSALNLGLRRGLSKLLSSKPPLLRVDLICRQNRRVLEARFLIKENL